MGTATSEESIRVTRMTSHFVGRIEGLDLRQPLTPEQAARVRKEIAEHGVLVFPGQHLDDDQQLRVIQVFGPAKRTSFAVTKNDNDYLIDITNVDKEGRLLPYNDSTAMFMRANLQWHADGSYNELPHRVTTLNARELPDLPPPTEYADTRAAWEALPAARQRELEGLVVEHDRAWSLAKAGLKPGDLSADAERRFAHQPLVRTNAITGRKSLYIGSHASHIVGRPLEEGRALINELVAHATQPEFVYSHRWQLHDLVAWDGSLTMHRATPYDAPHGRRLRQGGATEPTPLLAA
ncbi:MAG: tfdA [Ramlibacter sp.]|nr:tfdA [Ramlibacter sp.]